MALINDPDDLNQSAQAASGTPDGEVFINPATSPPTIELISSTDGYAGSNLIAADGVNLQALYSFLKEEWKSDATLIQYPFPMEAITSEQFEFINDWELNDATTASRTYVRTGGWAEKDDTGTVKQEYMSVITLGTFIGTPTAYYAWDGDVAKTDFTYAGPVNEAVQIYGDAANGDFDNRSTNLTVFIRPDTSGSSGSVEGYTFDSSTTTAIGATTVTYQAYRFPLSSSVDLDLDLTDVEIAALVASKTFDITWYGAQQNSSTYLSPDLNGGPYLFSIVVDNATNNATPNEVYNVAQYWMRQTSDIDENTGGHYGVLTPELMQFVGPNLETFDINSSGILGGVLIGSIDNNYAANFKMTDDGGTQRIFPSISSGNMVFNSNLIEDAASKYWLFFDNANGNTYPGSSALIVDNYAGTDLTGDLHHQTTTPTSGNASDTNGSVTSAGFVLTSAAAGWTADDFIGKVLVVTEAANANAGYYWITDSDTTTITVDRAFEETSADLDFTIRDKNTTGVVSWDFDYTNNVQGGRTGGADADVSIVALGLETGQYVLATGNTIIEGSGQNFSVTAALERNYNDPV